MDEPSRILDGLNEQQKKVATTLKGPVLVVAGAGSGKTTTLVRRVAWMIEQGVPPGQILLLTFTRAAAAGMLAKARALTPEAEGVFGGTFHSVANSLLREIHPAFGLPPNFTIIDPQDAAEAVKACVHLRPFPEEGNAPRASTIAGVLSLATNSCISVKDALEKKSPDWIEQAAWFEAIGELYAAYKKERALLDYDDLLLHFAAAVADPELGPQIRARWPYVMVDEHQDSNPVQLDIIYGLGGDEPNVMAVGDPAQAIYGFRGSAPGTMFHFSEKWPAAQVLVLETNYRSTAPILDLVNAIDRSMPTRFDRTLKPCREEEAEMPWLVRCQDDRQQAAELGARVLAARDEDGFELKDQAVLVRSMWVARRLEMELISKRIPYRVSGGIKIDEAAHIKDVLSAARIADNPMNEPAWLRCLTLLGGVGAKGAGRILEAVLKEISAGSSIHAAMEKAPWPKKADPKPLIEAFKELSSPGFPGDLLERAAKRMEPILKERYRDDWSERRKDVQMLCGLAGDHPSMTAFLAAVTIDYSLDRSKKGSGAEKSDEQPLNLSTIHSAKGLEWGCVHVPSFRAGHLPSSYAETPEELEEELRVFYVAASRAARRLVFYRPLMDDNGALLDDSAYADLVSGWVEEVKPKVRPAAPAAAGWRFGQNPIQARPRGRW